MHFHGHFELEPITINVLDVTSEVSLSLAMHTSPYPSGNTLLPISGFPRRIMADVAGDVATAPILPGRNALGMHRAPSKSSLRSVVAPITPTSPPPPYLQEQRAASRTGHHSTPRHSPIATHHEEAEEGEEEHVVIEGVVERKGAFTNYSGKTIPTYERKEAFVLGQPPRRVRN